MFYRIKDGKIYDYADYEYVEGCLCTNICTMAEYQNNPEIYAVENGVLNYVNNYRQVIMQQRQNQFEREFFNTSLGWIRRQVNMKDGSKKDFLADILMSVKAGMEMGQDVKIITYKTPDFLHEPNIVYLESLQELKSVTPKFIQECLLQTVQDFGGVNIGVNIGEDILQGIDENDENSISEIDAGGNDGV